MDKNETLSFLLATLKHKNGYVEWNQFRSGITQKISLVQAELNEADLKGYNLTRVDLTAAKLFNADLSGVDLSYSNLSYADLRRANLASAFLTNTNLTVAQLQGANMVDTNLDYACLKSAKLGGAYLVGATLIEADLEGADLRGATLKFANLTGARVKDTNVEDADLTNAIFSDEMIPGFKNFNRAILASSQLQKTSGDKSAGKARELLSETYYEDLFPEADCYRILGVDRNASFEEIQQAYKKRLKEYHPDLVVNLGEKIKIVARREFERIQLAYKSLSRHRSKPLMQFQAGARVKLPNKPLRQYTIEDFLHLTILLPDNDRVYYNLGVKYFEAGLYESAIQAYEKALTLNPNNKFAEQNLKIARLALLLKES
ncbi:MAG: pentapeptide repeat-containing protein [Candidatus Sumerlaeia bacterium]|nr:pentapeptide repeat-containing protein [Candidatus Sumerlaeia bacterium]